MKKIIPTLLFIITFASTIHAQSMENTTNVPADSNKKIRIIILPIVNNFTPGPGNTDVS
jgi:hypothetical protein